MMLLRTTILLLLTSTILGQWGDWSDWSECPPCSSTENVEDTGSRRLATGEPQQIFEKNRIRTKQCVGPLECVEDELTFPVGANISKISTCPPCESVKEDLELSISQKTSSENVRKCEVQSDGQEVCICQFGECDEESEVFVNSTITTEETRLQHCVVEPCKNGGDCLENAEERLCLCKPGFQGKDCEIDVDECESQPCINGGKCEDLVNDFKCNCTFGYEGKLCETNIDDCENDKCQNGGYCVDLLGDYQVM